MRTHRCAYPVPADRPAPAPGSCTPRSHQLPHIGLARGLRVAIGHSRHTKIQNLRLTTFVHQNVARFQIAVNDTALMRTVHAIADLSHEIQPLARVQLKGFSMLQQR